VKLFNVVEVSPANVGALLRPLGGLKRRASHGVRRFSLSSSCREKAVTRTSPIDQFRADHKLQFDSPGTNTESPTCGPVSLTGIF
jgi:hypothetical protein